MMAMVTAPEDEPLDAAGAAVTVGAAPVAPLGAEVTPGLSDDAAPAAVSVRTGAGFSGSGPPGGVGSIHRTTDPSEYVWRVLNAIEPIFGSGPNSIGNSWNWPGLIAVAAEFAVQTISLTACVT
jgi:hypothetical protein